VRSFGCASTAARLFVGTTTLPRSTWSVHLLVLVGPAPPFYGPTCSLHTVRMLALAFSIGGPFGASSAPIETQSTVLNEFGSVFAHAFFLWLVVYAVTGLLAPQTWFPPHCPWYSSCCLKSFWRRRDVRSACRSTAAVSFGLDAAAPIGTRMSWTRRPLSLSPGTVSPGPDRFDATTAHDPHISRTFRPPFDRLYRPQDAWFDLGRAP